MNVSNLSPEQEQNFWLNQFRSDDHLLLLDDVLDGFYDQTSYDRKAITLYLQPDESRAIKILAAQIDQSMTSIVIYAAEHYQISHDEIAFFQQQPDRKGAKTSSLFLTPDIRARHKKMASLLNLTGNQFYRLLINGVLASHNKT